MAMRGLKVKVTVPLEGMRDLAPHLSLLAPFYYPSQVIINTQLTVLHKGLPTS